MVDRYQLPTVSDLGLEEVQPLRYTGDFRVLPTSIGETDNELRARAEAGNWDLYETHGIDADTLPLEAIRNRFHDSYQQGGGHLMDEPGAFITAIWQAQRRLPNQQEYVNYLYENAFLNTYEARAAVLSREDVDALPADSDEAYEYQRAQRKMEFYANVEVDAPIDDVEIRDMASRYATLKAKPYDDWGAVIRQNELLMAARGLNEPEQNIVIDAINNRKNMRDVINPFRYYGLSPEQADRLQALRRPSFFSGEGFKNPQSLADESLNGDAVTQLAVRQFFGGQNLVDFLEGQLALETAIRDRGLAFTQFMVDTALAGSRLVEVSSEVHTHTSSFLDPEVSDRTGIEPAALAKLGSLAAFVSRENPLRSLLDNYTSQLVVSDFRHLIDTQLNAANN